MGKARKKRRRRGYPPRSVYRELHHHLSEFLDSLSSKEREVFAKHRPVETLLPTERLRVLRNSPPCDEFEKVLAKLGEFLAGRQLSRDFLKYFKIRDGLFGNEESRPPSPASEEES